MAEKLWAANGVDRLERYHVDPRFPATAEQEMNEPPAPPPPTPIAPLEPVHLKCFLKPDIRFRPNGMCELLLEIPFEYRAVAARMVAYSGRVLEVYVRPMVMDRTYD